MGKSAIKLSVNRQKEAQDMSYLTNAADETQTPEIRETF